MRCFIAIPLDHQLKSVLEQAQIPFRLHRHRGNFTSLDNFHLTLAFNGELDQQQIAQIGLILEDLDFQPFELTLHELGCFNRKDGEIWWVGVKPTSHLLQLQSHLVSALRNAEIPFEDQRFVPHLTLVRNYKPRQDTASIILPQIQPVSMIVRRISLMKSERIQGELRYTEIDWKDLNDS